MFYSVMLLDIQKAEMMEVLESAFLWCALFLSGAFVVFLLFRLLGDLLSIYEAEEDDVCDVCGRPAVVYEEVIFFDRLKYLFLPIVVKIVITPLVATVFVLLWRSLVSS